MQKRIIYACNTTMEDTDVTACSDLRTAQKLCAKYTDTFEKAQSEYRDATLRVVLLKTRLELAEKQVSHCLSNAANALQCLTQCVGLISKIEPDSSSNFNNLNNHTPTPEQLLKLHTCFDWNSGHCRRTQAECWYRHLCETCRSSTHRAVECPENDSESRTYIAKCQTYCRRWNDMKGSRCYYGARCYNKHLCMKCDSADHSLPECDKE